LPRLEITEFAPVRSFQDRRKHVEDRRRLGYFENHPCFGRGSRDGNLAVTTFRVADAFQE
jgi:hypothetical protein